MNILITGINGFIGRALHTRLFKDHIVFGISNKGLSSGSVFQLDLTDDEAVREFLDMPKDFDIDVIVHLASYMAQGDTSNHHSIVGQNAKMTDNVINIIRKWNIKFLVNMSSTSVYPNIDGVFSEDSKIDPSMNTDCYYGLSKWNAEVMFNYQLKKHRVQMLHLRTGMVFGDGMNETRLYPIILKELKANNKATLYGKGVRMINYIYIEELLDYILLMLKYKVTGVYNVINHSTDLINFTHSIADKHGIKDYQLELLDEGNSFRFIVDNSKLKSLLAKHV